MVGCVVNKVHKYFNASPVHAQGLREGVPPPQCSLHVLLGEGTVGGACGSGTSTVPRTVSIVQ